MSTPSTALEGIAARPAPAPTLKIVPARHPLQVVGTVLALALILIALQSVLGNPRWGWSTFAEWFFARPVLEGLGRTLLLTALGTGLGFALGTLLALARVSGSPLLSAVSWGYVWLFRSIPLLVLLIVVYYALPFVGIKLSPFLSAVTALSLVSAAYTAEIFRAGIEAIPSGQFEASAALGLSSRHTMVDVILPQAIRIVVPPLTNNCINVLKDTALASVVAMPDLLKQATQAQSLAANPTPLIGAAAIYVALLWPLVTMVARLEKQFSRGRR